VSLSHQMTGTATYISWKNMKARCTNPNNEAYSRYGGSGITYDPSWEDFNVFYKDMGDCPVGCTLERNNNALGYNKTNCSWEWRSTQNLNKKIPVNNQSGLKGVHWCVPKKKWIVKIPNGHRNAKAALQTSDFFEACCKRKSWEARRGTE